MKYWMLLGLLGLVLNVGTLTAGEADGATIVVGGDGKTVKVEAVIEVEGDAAAKDEKDKERRHAYGRRFFGGGGQLANAPGAINNWKPLTNHQPLFQTWSVAPRRNTADQLAYKFGDIIDTESRARLDQLPYGVERRLFTNTPIGGIDNPGATWGNMIGVEDYFVLTEEQNKAVTALREEFKQAQDKLARELFEQQREWAKKIVELRLGFEQRANDVLTGDDKAKKEELDKFMREIVEKNHAIAVKLLDGIKQPPADAQAQDWQGVWQAQQEVTKKADEETLPNIVAAEQKLLDSVGEATKAKIQEIVKQQVDRREQAKKWAAEAAQRQADWQKRQQEEGNRGDRRREGQQAVPPPKAPEGNAEGF